MASKGAALDHGLQVLVQVPLQAKTNKRHHAEIVIVALDRALLHRNFSIAYQQRSVQLPAECTLIIHAVAVLKLPGIEAEMSGSWCAGSKCGAVEVHRGIEGAFPFRVSGTSSTLGEWRSPIDRETSVREAFTMPVSASTDQMPADAGAAPRSRLHDIAR